MASFFGTEGADRLLGDFLSAGVTTDPSGLTGTRTGTQDDIHAGAGNDTVEAGDDDGEFTGSTFGGSGNDLLFGGASWDFLYGDDGNDTIHGGLNSFAPSDNIDGGAGNDLIYAAANYGNYIDGGSGTDTMYGATGDDSFSVDTSGDVVIETENGGYDDITSTAARYTLPTYVETLYFRTNSPAIGIGNELSNSINSTYFELGYGNGNDTLSGLGGDDDLFSGNGADKLLGGRGDDELHAGRGEDRLIGGSGNDSLVGGGEADRLAGGRGDDIFLFTDPSDSPASRRDTIEAGDGRAAFQCAGKAAGDLIDLSRIDGDLTTSGDQALVFGGTGTGHVSFAGSGSNTVLRANLDDDAAFEFQIVIADGDVRPSAYTASDLILA